MSETYTTYETDRPTEDELARLRREMLSNTLDDTERVLTLGFGGPQSESLYQQSAERLDKEPAAPEWTRRGVGAITLVNLAEVDVSQLYKAQQAETTVADDSLLGYAERAAA